MDADPFGDCDWLDALDDSELLQIEQSTQSFDCVSISSQDRPKAVVVDHHPVQLISIELN